MSRVIFSIKYEIKPERRPEYIRIVRELKHLVSAEGLESYAVYEHKSKKNHFEEIYIFKDHESYDAFDDQSDERIDLLMTKLSDLIQQHTMHYKTLFEVES
jgi:quinol monooxygenase YgiN